MSAGRVGFWLRPALLLVLVVASALAVSYSVHEARRLTARAQELQAEQDRLKTQWGQLLLERSTWGAYGRVERLAREELNMKVPEGDERVVVKP